MMNPRSWIDVMEIIDSRKEMEATDSERQSRLKEGERWRSWSREEKRAFTQAAVALVTASQPEEPPPQPTEEEEAERRACLRFHRIIYRTGLPSVLDVMLNIWGEEKILAAMQRKQGQKGWQGTYKQ